MARVKALYKELNLHAVCMWPEEDSHSHRAVLTAPAPAISLGLAHKIYKWKKEPRDYQGREGRFSINYSKS